VTAPQSQNPRWSSTASAVLVNRGSQIRPKSSRNAGTSLFSELLKEIVSLRQIESQPLLAESHPKFNGILFGKNSGGGKVCFMVQGAGGRQEFAFEALMIKKMMRKE